MMDNNDRLIKGCGFQVMEGIWLCNRFSCWRHIIKAYTLRS